MTSFRKCGAVFATSFVLAMAGCGRGSDAPGETAGLPARGDVNLNLNLPIVSQAGVPRARVPNSDIEYTRGKIDDPRIVAQLERLNPSQAAQFLGRNFVNREAGFVMTVEHPGDWMIRHYESGMAGGAPVDTIYNAELAAVSVSVSRIGPNVDIQQFMSANIQQMRAAGAFQKNPQVSIDAKTETAFAIYVNSINGGQAYQKVVIDRGRGRAFVVSANYNNGVSTPGAIRDLVTMAASFTLFGEPTGTQHP